MLNEAEGIRIARRIHAALVLTQNVVFDVCDYTVEVTKDGANYQTTGQYIGVPSLLNKHSLIRLHALKELDDPSLTLDNLKAVSESWYTL